MCLAGVVSTDINVDVLPLVLTSVVLIATHPEWLILTLHPVMLLFCSAVLFATADVSVFAYTLRTRARTRQNAKPHRHRLLKAVLSQVNLVYQRCANLVLPGDPHVGVFVRLGIISLFVAEVITMSPWEFVRNLNPYLNLPPWVLPMDAAIPELGVMSLMLPIIMTIFGLFAYSLTWSPRWARAFRAIGAIYFMLLSASLLIVIRHLLSQDYVMDLITRFIVILPLTLVSAYLAWISEMGIRRFIVSRVKKTLRQSQNPSP
jgi:hypothetical protein